MDIFGRRRKPHFDWLSCGVALFDITFWMPATAGMQHRQREDDTEGAQKRRQASCHDDPSLGTLVLIGVSISSPMWGLNASFGGRNHCRPSFGLLTLR
jgi:hypothetical protein